MIMILVNVYRRATLNTIRKWIFIYMELLYRILSSDSLIHDAFFHYYDANLVRVSSNYREHHDFFCM